MVYIESGDRRLAGQRKSFDVPIILDSPTAVSNGLDAPGTMAVACPRQIRRQYPPALIYRYACTPDDIAVVRGRFGACGIGWRLWGSGYLRPTQVNLRHQLRSLPRQREDFDGNANLGLGILLLQGVTDWLGRSVGTSFVRIDNVCLREHRVGQGPCN